MEDHNLEQELASIRGLMERSSKFLSLSGLSGILAGIYALIGSGVFYLILQSKNNHPSGILESIINDASIITYLFIVATLVLILSVITAIILSKQKAKRKGQFLWGKISQLLVFNMSIPLLAGGFLIIIFLYQGYFGLIIPAMLIFYGLSLIGAGNFTFADVKYLGLCEIMLGLIAAIIPAYALIFWAIGFGVLHIVYGSIMYLKYDR